MYLSPYLPVLQIHEECRKKGFKEGSKIVPTVNNSTESEFSISDNCLFCGKEIQRPSTVTSQNVVYHQSS